MATSKPVTIAEFKRAFPKETYIMLKTNLAERDLKTLLKQHNFGDDILDFCTLKDDLIKDGFFSMSFFIYFLLLSSRKAFESRIYELERGSYNSYVRKTHNCR